MNKIIVVINAGSSSLKSAIFDGYQELLRCQVEGDATTFGSMMADTFKSLSLVLNRMELQPTVVVHRIVHGGQDFVRPTVLTQSVLKRLTRLGPLAPAHMPQNLRGVWRAKRRWPRAKQLGVFDTALYHHLPAAVYLYAIPLALSTKWGIRRYGFHGISHQWAFSSTQRQRPASKRRLSAVTLHLGSGDSMTAWHNGQPIDTSMGFSPLEGLTMSTRSGDLDPMIPLFLQKKVGMSLAEVEDMVTHRSGLFGITGLRDMRDILDAAGIPVKAWQRVVWSRRQRQHAQLALAMYIYDIRRYLSSYLGMLSTTSVIIFTGAIGQNKTVQRLILRQLPAARGHQTVTIPTDEERAIAAQVRPMIHSIQP
ncbi:MAG: hypothetical protein HY092_04135 [Candidatus Kerfeldbacteria bacterium]|nr:hypothetical protein [Candidatus Kerfeldbacteria bacterium]